MKAGTRLIKNTDFNVSIICLAFKDPEKTIKAVNKAKLACGSLSIETIIVDNASTQKSSSILRQSCPNAILIENHENLGFARGMNCGLKIARGEYALLLNSDVYALDNSIELLYKCLTSSQSGQKKEDKRQKNNQIQTLLWQHLFLLILMVTRYAVF